MAVTIVVLIPASLLTPANGQIPSAVGAKDKASSVVARIVGATLPGWVLALVVA